MTEEKTFEKQFPRLSQNTELFEEFKKHYFASMVKEHCLDKDIVLAALERHNCAIPPLLKELGLEQPKS